MSETDPTTDTPRSPYADRTDESLALRLNRWLRDHPDGAAPGRTGLPCSVELAEAAIRTSLAREIGENPAKMRRLNAGRALRVLRDWLPVVRLREALEEVQLAEARTELPSGAAERPEAEARIRQVQEALDAAIEHAEAMRQRERDEERKRSAGRREMERSQALTDLPAALRSAVTRLLVEAVEAGRAAPTAAPEVLVAPLVKQLRAQAKAVPAGRNKVRPVIPADRSKPEATPVPADRNAEPLIRDDPRQLAIPVDRNETHSGQPEPPHSG